MSKVIFFVFFQLSVTIYSQTTDSISISGHIVTFENQNHKGYILAFKDKKIIKSFDIINGDFYFKLPTSIEVGVYRIKYKDEISEPYTDIIINCKERNIKYQLKSIYEGVLPNFIYSLENQKWYDYLKNTNSKVNVLNKLFKYLSEFTQVVNVNQILRIYQKERKNYYHLFFNFIKVNKGTLASQIVENKPYYFSDLKKPPIPRDFIRLNYYWDGIDASNINLINTPIYEDHVETYLDAIIKSNENNNLVQRTYITQKAIDDIVKKFSGTVETKKCAVKNIVAYFKKTKGYESMVDYVITHYFIKNS